MVSLSPVLKLVVRLLYGCPERDNNPGRIRENFMYRHWKLKVVILQKEPEPLKRCNHRGMHMPVACLVNHRYTDRCEKATGVRLRQRGGEMTERFGETKFRLCGRDWDAMVEGVSKFKDLGRPPDQMNDDWLVVQQNIKWVRRVWERLGEMLRREGEDSKVAEMFYREVLQAVLLFRSGYWFLSTSMERIVEETHTSFLKQITVKQAWRRVK